MKTDSANIEGLAVVMGVSGCGKSSVAQRIAGHFNAGFLEADDLHPRENIEKMSSGTPLTDLDRLPWLELVRDTAREIQLAKGCCIVACSALKLSYRDILRQTCDPTWFVFLEGSRELISARMHERSGHFMPTTLLDSQFSTLENPTHEAGVVTVPIIDNMEQVADNACHELALLTNSSA